MCYASLVIKRLLKKYLADMGFKCTERELVELHNSSQVVALIADADENYNRVEIYIKLSKQQEILPKRRSHDSNSRRADKLLMGFGISPFHNIEIKKNLMWKLHLVHTHDFSAPS